MRTSTPTLVLVCAKLPSPGRVKTRLAAAIGSELAARFAGAFLEDTLRLCHDQAGIKPILFGDRPDSGPFEPQLRDLPPTLYWPQGEGHLGERLRRGFERGLHEFPRVVAIGADTPDLPPKRLLQAAEVLKRSEVVLGPAPDGGYYLIGLPAEPFPPYQIFEGDDWGSPEVLSRTRSQLLSDSIAFTELEPWNDVDTVVDLRQLTERLRRGARGCAKTRELLEIHAGSDLEIL